MTTPFGAKQGNTALNQPHNRWLVSGQGLSSNQCAPFKLPMQQMTGIFILGDQMRGPISKKTLTAFIVFSLIQIESSNEFMCRKRHVVIKNTKPQSPKMDSKTKT